MISKEFRSGSVISIWLSIAAMCMHMVIIHDHHIADTYTGNGTDCPASNHEQGNKPESPIHCHAFNDLVSEKARTFNISEKITDGFISSAILQDSQIIFHQNSVTGITEFHSPVGNSYSHFLFLLRAPPALT